MCSSEITQSVPVKYHLISWSVNWLENINNERENTSLQVEQGGATQIVSVIFFGQNKHTFTPRLNP